MQDHVPEHMRKSFVTILIRPVMFKALFQKLNEVQTLFGQWKKIPLGRSKMLQVVTVTGIHHRDTIGKENATAAYSCDSKDKAHFSTMWLLMSI